MNGNLTYNSNSLQTFDPVANTGILTNVIEHTNLPEKVATLFALADADASAISSINYPSKIVNIAGMIKGSTQADLDNRIDTFKGYFIGKDKNLDITYGSSTRRYIATANTISVVRQDKALFATFAIEFICTNPFGLDTVATSLISEIGYTSASLISAMTIGGTAPYQLPIITITINALTGDGDYIQISNDNNGQDMLIHNLGLEAGDIVVIDSSTRTVKVNGTVVDYSGVFLELDPGSNSITYADGFTTRDVDIEAEYYKRWL